MDPIVTNNWYISQQSPVEPCECDKLDDDETCDFCAAELDARAGWEADHDRHGER